MERFVKFARHTVAFQEMGATELRLLAREVPSVAERLFALASHLQAHAEDARRLTHRAPAQPLS
jgi:hypothetical protein